MKQTITDLKAAVQTAKDKQKAAKEECKKLEKDMDEFKNNKEGKIDELKVRRPSSVSIKYSLTSFITRLISQSKRPHYKNMQSSSRPSRKRCKRLLWS